MLRLAETQNNLPWFMATLARVLMLFRISMKVGVLGVDVARLVTYRLPCGLAFLDVDIRS